jgi:hypothetical protein
MLKYYLNEFRRQRVKGNFGVTSLNYAILVVI